MFVAQHYSKLSEAGKTQYDKYSEYYEDKYFDYSDELDWVAVIESDARQGIKH